MAGDRHDDLRGGVLESLTDCAAISFLAQIKEDLDAHHHDWTQPGFRALVIHRFGVRRSQLRPKLLRAPLSVAYRCLYRYARNRYGIELPYSAQIGRRVRFEHQSGIVLHGNAVIGDDCIIRQGVTIGNRYDHKQFDAPRLGNRVNVGVGATLLGGITIGDDVSIGANSVVLDDVPASSTVAGPKAVIRPRRDGGAAFEPEALAPHANLQ